MNLIKLGILLLLLSSTSDFIIHATCTQETIEHLENGLRLSGDESQTIETDTLIIIGNIKLSDNAHLRIINCNLTLLQNPGISSQGILLSEYSKLELINTTISKSAGFEVKDNGKLTVKNSLITGTSHIWLYFRDNSSLSFINSNCYGKGPKGSLHWVAEDMLPEGALREYWDDHTFSFEDTSTINIHNSTVGSVRILHNSVCTIFGSKISILDTNSLKESLVENSDIKVLTATVTDADFEYTGRIEGFHNEWSSESFFGPENKNNLRLIESSIDNLWLKLVNCNSTIYNAKLFYLSTYSGESNITNCDIKFLKNSDNNPTIASSKIQYLIGTSYQEPLRITDCKTSFIGLSAWDNLRAEISNTSIEDCRVNNFYMPDIVDVKFDNVKITDLWLNPVDQFDIYFNNCQVNGEITLLAYQKSNENASIYGDVSFSHDSSLKHYPNTALMREYRVQVMSDWVPQSGVIVQLIKDGETWREYITDESGEVRFKIKWVDYSKLSYFLDYYPNNLTDTITVSILESKKPLSIFSSTPIIFETYSVPVLHITVTAVILVLLFANSLYALKRIWRS